MNYFYPSSNRISRDATSRQIEDTFKMISGLGATCVTSSQGLPINIRLRNNKTNVITEYFEPSCGKINPSEVEIDSITFYMRANNRNQTMQLKYHRNHIGNCSDCEMQGSVTLK